jgi:hypothetical protein
VRRQGSHHEDPEWIVADRSEIDAVETPHLSRGYWSRMLDYLKILPPDKAVKLNFPTGVPRAVESSIYGAATRKQMRVGVYVRPSAVYICKNGHSEALLKFPIASKARCMVCGAALHLKPGTGKQFVCAGTRKKKSECQKIWRYAREHGLSVEDALQRRSIEDRVRPTGDE